MPSFDFLGLLIPIYPKPLLRCEHVLTRAFYVNENNRKKKFCTKASFLSAQQGWRRGDKHKNPKEKVGNERLASWTRLSPLTLPPAINKAEWLSGLSRFQQVFLGRLFWFYTDSCVWLPGGWVLLQRNGKKPINPTTELKAQLRQTTVINLCSEPAWWLK